MTKVTSPRADIKMEDITTKNGLGARMKEVRENAGVTQAQIAAACGLSKNYVSAVERGINKCNCDLFIAYGKLCGVSLDALACLPQGEQLVTPLLIETLSLLNREEQERFRRILEIYIEGARKDS